MKIVLVVFTLILASCASIMNTDTQVELTSLPVGAEVWQIKAGSPLRKLGETPMVLTTREVSELDAEPTQLRMQKDGYRAQNILLSPTPRSHAQLYIKLDEVLSEDKMLSELAKQIAEVQFLISRKDYAIAETQALQLTGKFPTISVAWDLLGNIYFIQKSYSKALSVYKKSLEIEPTNSGASRMVRRLESLVVGGSK